MSMSSRRYWDAAQAELGSLPFETVPTAHTLTGAITADSAITSILKLGHLLNGNLAPVSVVAAHLAKVCQLYGNIGSAASLTGRANAGRIGRAQATDSAYATATVTDS